MYIDIIVMNREIENKQMIYVAKKAFQTNGIEIKYNCAKRYHILWTNCAKGILFESLTVLHVTIFLLICNFLSPITRQINGNEGCRWK